jgi:hypothetical protein
MLRCERGEMLLRFPPPLCAKTLERGGELSELALL